MISHCSKMSNKAETSLEKAVVICIYTTHSLFLFYFEVVRKYSAHIAGSLMSLFFVSPHTRFESSKVVGLTATSFHYEANLYGHSIFSIFGLCIVTRAWESSGTIEMFHQRIFSMPQRIKGSLCWIWRRW